MFWLAGLRRPGFAGVTVIELLLVMAYVCAFYICARRAWSMAAEDGLAWQIISALLGGMMGIAGVMAALFLLLSPFWLYLMVSRAMAPADLVCRCGEDNSPIPSQLLPSAGIGESAMAESRLLGHIGELVFARSAEPLSIAHIPPGFEKTSGWAERISIAAHLDLRMEGLAAERFNGPKIKYQTWSGLPREMLDSLRSGLPPRLILAWGILLMERALPVFEKEFHQDTRPGQIIGASAMILKSGNEEAVSLCQELSQAVWSPEHFGCRIARRGLVSRVMDLPSPGHQAGLAAYSLAQLASHYARPERLWLVYQPGDMRRGYETPENRIAWSQPGYYAEAIAGYCARALGDKRAEMAWQKKALARLILSWERWAEDREAWRSRLENEWAPMMEKTDYGKGFDKPAFILAAKERLAPWKGA